MKQRALWENVLGEGGKVSGVEELYMEGLEARDDDRVRPSSASY